jgi:hypothetical protein
MKKRVAPMTFFAMSSRLMVTTTPYLPFCTIHLG